MPAGNHVEFLVDGEEIFRSLYNDIQAVDRDGFIYICSWMVDPSMTIHTGTGQTLGNLLAQKARQGVTIRLMVWDFYIILVDQIARGGRSAILPRAEIPNLVRVIQEVVPPCFRIQFARLFARNRNITIDNLMDFVNRLRGAPQPAPGQSRLDRLLQCLRQPSPADIELCVAPFPDPGMPPGRSRILGLNIGSHHQKTAIINRPSSSGRRLRAYVLGTNLHNDYVDTDEHYVQYPAGDSVRCRPWHDAGTVSEGPVANDIEAEFIRRWELQRNNNYPQLSEITPSGITRRFSQNINADLLITAPTPPANNVLNSLSDCLRGAQTSIYIEDQYFIYPDLTDIIIESALRLERLGRTLHIALLTNSPFEFEGDGDGVDNQLEVYRYVNFINLQLATCEGVRVARPGEHPGSLSTGPPIRRPPGLRWQLHPNSGEQQWNLPNLQIHANGRPVLANRNPVTLSRVRQIVGGVRPAWAISADGSRDLIGRGHSSGEGHQARYTRDIYIHAKITIIDDRVAFIGSPNYSIRSQEYDSEATLKVDDPAFALDARFRLFEEMTGRTDVSRLSVERQFHLWNGFAHSNALVVNVDGATLQGGFVHLVQYPTHPASMPNFQALRGRISRQLARSDSVIRRLLARELGGASLGTRLMDQQFLRLLERLSPLH
jgi:phosphatidylserine/phosphatidylglycerophosphate/cardiolipin synthase-like enzyme